MGERDFCLKFKFLGTSILEQAETLFKIVWGLNCLGISSLPFIVAHTSFTQRPFPVLPHQLTSVDQLRNIGSFYGNTNTSKFKKQSVCKKHPCKNCFRSCSWLRLPAYCFKAAIMNMGKEMAHYTTPWKKCITPIFFFCFVLRNSIFSCSGGIKYRTTLKSYKLIGKVFFSPFSSWYWIGDSLRKD